MNICVAPFKELTKALKHDYSTAPVQLWVLRRGITFHPNSGWDFDWWWCIHSCPLLENLWVWSECLRFEHLAIVITAIQMPRYNTMLSNRSQIRHGAFHVMFYYTEDS